MTIAHDTILDSATLVNKADGRRVEYRFVQDRLSGFHVTRLDARTYATVVNGGSRATVQRKFNGMVAVLCDRSGFERVAA